MPFIVKHRNSDGLLTDNPTTRELPESGIYTTSINNLGAGQTGVMSLVRGAFLDFTVKNLYPKLTLNYHTPPNSGLPLVDLYLVNCASGDQPESSGYFAPLKNYIGTGFGYFETPKGTIISSGVRSNFTINLPKIETMQSFNIMMVNRGDLTIATGILTFYKDILNMVNNL